MLLILSECSIGCVVVTYGGGVHCAAPSSCTAVCVGTLACENVSAGGGVCSVRVERK